MLRVARIADRTGRYYLADLATELDARALGATDDPRPPLQDRRWIGASADRLGLTGSVTAPALAAVLSGRHPSAGHRLRARETVVTGYDLTFAAPKSASVLSALGAPDAGHAVRTAHEDAVDAAMTYVAAHAVVVRSTTAEGRDATRVDGVVAASFTHGVSRALDPHLHSHVLVANLARGDDGRWRAIDARGLYAHARAAGALYDAVLRRGVSARLGLEWAPTRSRSWEVSAVDPVLLGALSSRRAEILADLHSHRGASRAVPGAPSRRADAVAWAATRDPKSVPAAPGELRARWERVARDVGAATELTLNVDARRSAHEELDEHRFAAAIVGGGQRSVTRRDVVAAWAGALPTGARGEALDRCVDALCDWGAGLGVAEEVRAPSAVIPPPHVIETLGPRPASPERLGVWQSAASSIERYRTQWSVDDPCLALGVGTQADLAAMPAQRLASHLSVTRTIDDALVTLGRNRDRDRDPGRRLESGRLLARDTR